MPLDPIVLQEYANRFFGYGSYHAPFWFVGIEEGGGKTEAVVNKRFQLWQQRKQRSLGDDSELEDCVEFNTELGFPEFFQPKPAKQPTWSMLSRVVLSIKRWPTNQSNIADYRRQFLGKRHGQTCLLELLPLPSPGSGNWSRFYVDTGLPFLVNRKAYEAYYDQRRSDHIRQRIEKYCPKVVVFYGVIQRDRYMNIAGANAHFVRIRVGDFSVDLGGNERTVFAITQHPTAPGIPNSYFHDVGRKIAEKLGW